ncbi:high affinity methionine permease [Ramaria rubella]|nr:high affinity methionine permease [Ramaria rubella]
MSQSYGQRLGSSSSSPLLNEFDALQYGSSAESATNSRDTTSGEAFDSRVPAARREIGVLSAISLIFNRMIGTGIYATPGLILRASGSVGLFLILWILGALVASVGMAVYVEFGTSLQGLPRSGGEKNYLEYIYRRPELLVTCCFAMFTCLMGWSAANSVVFGEYMVHALGGQIMQWNTRLLGFACVSAVTLLHITHLNWGLRLQNTLALAKLGVMLFIIISGLFAFLGWIPVVENSGNFDRIWEGTTRDPNAFVSGLYYVIWSFVGYSNAHYSLSETQDPVKILKKAAPLAMILITVMYLLVNVSYLVVISKDDIRDGGRIVAAYFFRNLFGSVAERVLSIVICISTLGNIMAVCFTHSRVIQELGREGVLPHSNIFSSNAPFNTPFAALVLQWAMCAFWMFFPPPGDAYNFVLNLHSYPFCWINFAISGGLLWLYLSPSGRANWDPPYRAGIPVITLFLLSNLFLAIAPLIPPAPGFSLYEHLPYWSHVAATGTILAVGVAYWYVWTKVMPPFRGNRLNRGVITQANGVSKSV